MKHPWKLLQRRNGDQFQVVQEGKQQMAHGREAKQQVLKNSSQYPLNAI